MEDEVKKATEKAMAVLLIKDRTKKELEDRLKRAGFSEKAVDAAMEYVQSFGYIDDARYAYSYISFRRTLKSRKEIAFKLLQRGVDKEVIQQAFYEFPDDDSEALKNSIRKKCNGRDLNEMDRVERQKVFAYLARRGFRASDISKCIQYWEE